MRETPHAGTFERIEDLRDEAVHLVISQIPADVIRLFQAGVINYHKRLGEWFGESLSDRYPIGMMSIVYDMSPEKQDMSDQRLQRELGIDAFEFLSRYCADIRQEFDNLQRSSEFSISVEYRLVLTKKIDGADIPLSSGAVGGEPTQIVEVAKDSSNSHPYRQKEVVEEVNVGIGGQIINSYDIQCTNRVYGVESRSEFFYQGKVKGSPRQYSRVYVEWLINKHKSDPDFFTGTRKQD